MAKVSFKIKSDKKIILTSNVQKRMKEAMEDIVTDLEKTSQQLAPKKTGKLETSVTSGVTPRGDVFMGYVEYKAYSTKGFNYAYKMENDDYNLGKESKKKKGSARSRFIKGRLTVGKGYLSNTAKRGRKAWREYYIEEVRKAKKFGFFGR